MSPQSQAPSLIAVSVLLVEDETLIREGLADCLRALSCEVHEARSGDDALDQLVAGLSVDVLFTDVQMPGGLDGLGLARWVRFNRPLMHVLIASGRVDLREAAGDLCEAGSLFAKPYEDDAVARRIGVLMD